MLSKRFLLIPSVISVLIFSGCSTINFSANYYTLPTNCPKEINELWNSIIAQGHFKKTYYIHIVERKESKRLKGIPAISNTTLLLPEDFIKYVYQNYYYDRARILTSVIVHEITHSEYNLPSKPADLHFKADLAAIKILGDDKKTATYYYKTLFVMKNYWYARKGVAGHSLNAGWNAVNGVSWALGGPAAFADFYATDLSRRMYLIAERYKVTSTDCFLRTSQ
jgi:hypothetical protein